MKKIRGTKQNKKPEKELKKLNKIAKENKFTVKSVGYDDYGKPILFVK